MRTIVIVMMTALPLLAEPPPNPRTKAGVRPIRHESLAEVGREVGRKPPGSAQRSRSLLAG
jgi:hypothetical protein